jgi:hypothetical protein
MPKYLNFTTGNDLLDEGIENYLLFGYEPGGFLSAVLAGDLFLAASRADHLNFQRLAEIARTVYHNMPAGTIGSYEIINEWIKDKSGRRAHYAETKKKEYVWKVLKGEADERALKEPPF